MPEAKAQDAADYLVRVMSEGPDWAEGLPLAVEATIGEYYSKVGD